MIAKIFRYLRHIDCALIYFSMPQLDQIGAIQREVNQVINDIDQSFRRQSVGRGISSKVSFSCYVITMILHSIRYFIMFKNISAQTFKLWNFDEHWHILFSIIDSIFLVFTTLNAVSLVCWFIALLTRSLTLTLDNYNSFINQFSGKSNF